jgi:hypothetical protein
MNPLDVANYGTAIFSISAVIYIVYIFKIKSENNCNKDSESFRLMMESNKSVIENNTKALENLSFIIKDLQINLAKQEEKLNELLERARK